MQIASSRGQMAGSQPKLAHDGPLTGLHPECAQGQGRGKRSRDTGTLMSKPRNGKGGMSEREGEGRKANGKRRERKEDGSQNFTRNCEIMRTLIFAAKTS